MIETLDGWVPCDANPKSMQVVRAAHEAQALEAAIRCGAAAPEDVEVRG